MIAATTNLKSVPRVPTREIDIDEVVDWSEDCQVEGFSSLTTKQVFYQKIGNCIFINFIFKGTSNADFIKAKLPYPYFNANFITVGGKAVNNSVAQTTSGRVFPNFFSNGENDIRDVFFYRDPLASTWATSGTKEIEIQFFYFTDKKTRYPFSIQPVNSYIDFTSGAAVTGFSSLSVNRFFYYRVGNVVLCWCYFDGTSNATTITCTLPFLPSIDFSANTGMVTNGGVRQSNSGLARGAVNNTTLNLYRDGALASFSSTGGKIWAGFFWFFSYGT